MKSASTAQTACCTGRFILGL